MMERFYKDGYIHSAKFTRRDDIRSTYGLRLDLRVTAEEGDEYYKNRSIPVVFAAFSKQDFSSEKAYDEHCDEIQKLILEVYTMFGVVSPEELEYKKCRIYFRKDNRDLGRELGANYPNLVNLALACGPNIGPIVEGISLIPTEEV